MKDKLILAIFMACISTVFYRCPVEGRVINEINEIKYEEIVLKQKERESQKEQKPITRYTKTSLNVRKEPNTNSKILDVLNFNEKVKVKKYNKNWFILVKDKKEYGYVHRKYLRKTPVDYEVYYIPEYSGYKSFMGYSKITDASSPQWLLQEEYAYTGDYGIRMINGRFCVAIGFAFNPKIGQYFDLILENGTVIPCIISDEKDPYDTDEDNIFTSDNGCCTEFVVDTDVLNSRASIMGDISYCDENWMSPVEKIKIYDKNVLED